MSGAGLQAPGDQVKTVSARLADAGGDVVGHGDDHGLQVIGWVISPVGAGERDSTQYKASVTWTFALLVRS